MKKVQYSKTSDDKILLMGEELDAPGIMLVKIFNTFDEALEYADNN